MAWPNKKIRLILPHALLVLCSLFLSSAVSAATFVVTEFNDIDDGSCDSHCSLREAVRATQTNVSDDTILLSAGTYTLGLPGTEDIAAGGDLDITTDGVSIVGAGSGLTTIIQTLNGDRVFDTVSSDSFSLSGVTLTVAAVATRTGGCIQHASGTLSLSDVIFDSCQSTAAGGALMAGAAWEANLVTFYNNSSGSVGGAIDNAATGVLNRATFQGNSSLGGGALRNRATITITNSSFYDNESSGNGGAIYSQCDEIITNEVNLTNVTIANNSAADDGGGIWNTDIFGLACTAAQVTMINVILDNNSAPTGPDCYDQLTNVSSSLISNPAGCTIDTGSSGGNNIIGSSADLDACNDSSLDAPGLGVCPLLATSPAINAGAAGSCPLADQEAQARSGVCDIGSSEFQAVDDGGDDGSAADGSDVGGDDGSAVDGGDVGGDDGSAVDGGDVGGDEGSAADDGDNTGGDDGDVTMPTAAGGSLSCSRQVDPEQFSQSFSSQGQWLWLAFPLLPLRFQSRRLRLKNLNKIK